MKRKLKCMIGISLKSLTGSKEVLLVNRENSLPGDVLSKDGLYCYLLQPRKQHVYQRKKATNRIWSEKAYRLKEVVENHVMYYLSDGSDRAFVSEELMLIPKDTELAPSYIQKW